MSAHRMRNERASQTARRNNAWEATYKDHALINPFAEGGFRYVAKGVYTHGERAGQLSVCKWFKTGVVYEERFSMRTLMR